MTDPPITLAALRDEVDAALATYLDEALPRLRRLHTSLAPLTDELRAFTAGGKRLRPVFLLLGHRAAGGEHRSAVHGPALALELLHTCALLHDDIIDAAPTRRGRPTTHVAFAAHHRDHGWQGDPDDFGAAVAILLGDLAFVQADELFLDARVAADVLLDALRLFTVLREEVMAGQYVDLFAATSATTSRELALAVATYKSGRYSVARPLEIGAVLAGAAPELVDGLAEFGGPLGRAFQVRDDLLGVFGQEGETGKSAAGDLREGKRTLLVAETAARLGGADAARFDALLGSDDLTADGAQELRELMRASGGLAATADYIATEVEAALDVLDGLDIEADAAAALRELAGFVRDRTA